MLSSNPIISNIYTDKQLIETYKILRSDYPVFWSDYHQSWIFSRYEDVVNALKDYKTYSYKNTGSMFIRDLASHITDDDHNVSEEQKKIFFDIEEPPEYLYKRKIILDIYNEIIQSGLELKIKNNIEYLFSTSPINKEFDIINNITNYIPVLTLCSMMDLQYDKKDQVLDIAKSFWEITTINQRMQRYKSAAKFIYLNKPGLFKMAGKKIDGQVITEETIMSICMGFLIGGSNSMTGALPGVIYFMHTNPEQFNNVIKDNNLSNNYIQEVLRHSFIMTHLVRTSTKNHIIHNQEIKNGDRVAFLLGSANFDESYIGKDAELFNINRNYKKVNLVFGNGAYRCIGYNIALMQLNCFMNYLLLNNNLYVNSIKFKDQRDFTGALYKNIFTTIKEF